MRKLNRIASSWQTVCTLRRFVMEWSGIEMRRLKLEKETRFETDVKDDDEEIRVRFSETISYSERSESQMTGYNRQARNDKTTKPNRNWIPDLRKIVGLFYFINILLGIIEFIPRPDITWIWIFIPVFWVQETAKSENQSDVEPTM